MFQGRLSEFYGMTMDQIKDKMYNILHPEILATQKMNEVLNNSEKDGISNTEINDDVIQIILKEYTTDEIFTFFSQMSGTYGVDQGCLTDISLFGHKLVNTKAGKKKASLAYDERYKMVTQFIQTKYGFSPKDSEKIFTIVDSVGACSYANLANIIFAEYKNDTDAFYEDFGFPYYQELSNGNRVMSDAELLVDIFIWTNMEKNGGNLIYTNKNGKNKIHDEALTTDSWNQAELASGDYQQYYSSTSKGIDENLVDNYLKSKSENLDFSTEKITSIDKAKKWLKNKDSELSLHINRNENAAVRYIDIETNEIIVTTDNWDEGGSHVVPITGFTDNGFIVSSWGKRCLVPFEDIINSGEYRISRSDININTKLDEI